jgi:hypothetical protein
MQATSESTWGPLGAVATGAVAVTALAIRRAR